MKTLIIVRHGAYNFRNPAIANNVRPLTSKGRRETVYTADQLAHIGISPDLIVYSPTLRAEKTAEIFGKKLGVSSDKFLDDPDIFAAERADLLRVINRFDDSKNTVLLVGHNPGLTAIFHHLVDSDISEMHSSAFAVIQVDVNRWKDVSFKKGELLHHCEPKVKDKKHGLRWKFFHWRKQRENHVEIFMIFLIAVILVLGFLGIIINILSNSLSGTAN